MQGLANERGFGRFLDDGAVSLGKTESSTATAIDRPPQRAKRRPFTAIKDVLDGLGGLGWSVLGFVGGAVFWHFVGFWGFLSDVVLAEGPAPAARTAAMHAAAPVTRSRWLQVADASQMPCTLLSLDRQTGITSARPCDSDHAPLPADSVQGREDRIAVDDSTLD